MKTIKYHLDISLFLIVILYERLIMRYIGLILQFSYAMLAVSSSPYIGLILFFVIKKGVFSF